MQGFEITTTSVDQPVLAQEVAKEAERLLSRYAKTQRDQASWRIIRAIFARKKVRFLSEQRIFDLATALRDYAPHVWEFYNRQNPLDLQKQEIFVAFLGPDEIPPQYRDNSKN